MKNKPIVVVLVSLIAIVAGATILAAQGGIVGTISGGEKPAIAVPDLRGSGEAQPLMNAFNETLWNELADSGALKMVAKSMYPLTVPQQPSDFRPPITPVASRRGQAAAPVSTGPWFTDWSNPPVNANYLAMGYTAVQDGRLVLYGWLYNTAQPTVASAQVIGKLYFGPLSTEGARQVARDFAADILRQFGAVSLAGSKIYYVSDRTGNKEIWSMDYDGTNQKQLTNYKSSSSQPAVSPDGKMFAFTTYAHGNPQIMIHSVETGRRIPFYNPVSSVVATPEFTPDGQHMLFAASIDGWTQIFESNVDGSGLRRISHVRAIEVSPRVNPKTGSDIVFISGRSGYPQLWHMTLEGTDLERLSSPVSDGENKTGEGEVANPAWSPNGKTLAFSWTKGFEPGNYNIFVMDMGTRQVIQLTHGEGRNENPWWAPDGVHIVFSSKRGPVTQIYTMLADGTNVKQLTTQGNNLQPVWSKGIN